jgi:3',5'-cyclic-nucleotide phosphodiesterase
MVALLGAAPAPRGFDVVALGTGGGVDDGNLSGMLIQPAGDHRAVACDAGTLVNGLRVARGKGAFGRTPPPLADLLRWRIRGYLISHAHLDHVAGLIQASPDDDAKPIYALPSVNAVLSSHYFNWRAWPNFGDRGLRRSASTGCRISKPGSPRRSAIQE